MGGLRRIGSLPADILSRLVAAETNASTAVSGTQNVRQMVLNRDPKLNQASEDATAAKAETVTLAQLAAQLGAAIPAADAVHADHLARIKTLEAAVSAMTGKTVTAQSKRVTTTQLLALGASIDLTATWPTPFPDANYVTIPLLDASTGVANVQGPFWKSQTKEAAVVTIRANIAVAAGLAVNVIGLRFG